MNSQLPRRLGRWVVTSAAAVATLFGVLAGAPATASADVLPDKWATIETQGDADNVVAVRASGNSSSIKISTRHDGDKVKLLCQLKGQEMTGYKGKSSTWYLVLAGGFVPKAKVRAGLGTDRLNYCNYTPAPLPAAGTQLPEGAINRAFAHLGSTAWEGDCLRFARTAYGRPSSWPTAEIGGDVMTRAGYMQTSGLPPRGALVWYHGAGGAGHVAISLGEGLVIGSSVHGRVGVAGYQAHELYRGSSRPVFPPAV